MSSRLLSVDSAARMREMDKVLEDALSEDDAKSSGLVPVSKTFKGKWLTNRNEAVEFLHSFGDNRSPRMVRAGWRLTVWARPANAFSGRR